MKAQVAILAGGEGKRLADRSDGLPKPMVRVAGLPLLEHQILLCKKYGFDRIHLLVGHKYEAITNYFSDGSRFGVSISYSIESEPRGTAGALFDALDFMTDDFLVLYGDVFLEIDLNEFFQSHLPSVVATIFLHPNDHPHDSDLIELDAAGYVKCVHPYPHDESLLVRNLVNAATYVVNKQKIREFLPAKGKLDIAKDIFPEIVSKGLLLKGYVSSEYTKDMGTGQRLDQVERDIFDKIPQRLSLTQKRRAVFIDRDGTIIEEVGHLSRIEDVRLLPGSARAIRRLNKAGLLAVCVTNQPVIARGELSIDGLNKIHAYVDALLGREGAYLDRLYFCPHHPHRGFPGEVESLKISCACRKPKTGMIDCAAVELNIDVRRSWIVGDSSNDILAGASAGLDTILVKTGVVSFDTDGEIKPDFECADLADAVDVILGKLNFV